MLKDSKRSGEILRMNINQLYEALGGRRDKLAQEAIESVSGLDEYATHGVLFGQMCGCGTCRDAVKAAVRTYVQLRENQCDVWFAQWYRALIYVGKINALLQRGYTFEEATSPETIEDERKLMEVTFISRASDAAMQKLWEGMDNYFAIDSHPEDFQPLVGMKQHGA